MIKLFNIIGDRSQAKNTSVGLITPIHPLRPLRLLRVISALLLLMLFSHTSATAQEKATIRFRSRGLFDVGMQDYNRTGIKTYYRVEDFRVGFKAAYGKYELKADVGIGNGKIGFKDLLISYNASKYTVSFGNCYEPFGLDMLISTYDLRLNQSASSILAITNSRRIGFTAHLHTPLLYAAAGVYTDNDINKLDALNIKQAYAFTGRAVFRPVMSPNSLIHIGIAISYRTKDKNNSGCVVGTYGVASFPSDNLSSVEIPNALNEFKTCTELYLCHNRFVLQSEFLTRRIARQGDKTPFLAHGGYAYLCFIVKGEGYGYDSRYGITERPRGKRALELVARFNYLNLNDATSTLYGGMHQDFSLGINYYLNKYMGLKLSGSYLIADSNCSPLYSRNYFTTQLRLQYIF